MMRLMPALARALQLPPFSPYAVVTLSPCYDVVMSALCARCHIGATADDAARCGALRYMLRVMITRAVSLRLLRGEQRYYVKSYDICAMAYDVTTCARCHAMLLMAPAADATLTPLPRAATSAMPRRRRRAAAADMPCCCCC